MKWLPQVRATVMAPDTAPALQALLDAIGDLRNWARDHAIVARSDPDTYTAAILAKIRLLQHEATTLAPLVGAGDPRTPPAPREPASTRPKSNPPTQNGWSPEEDEILRSLYRSKGVAATAEALGGRRSANAIKARARRLGLTRTLPAWSDVELAILKTVYPAAGRNAAHKALEEHNGSEIRTAMAVGVMASQLGLSSIRRQVPWTDEQDAIVREVYPREGLEATLKALGNKRSHEAVRTRAADLGVRSPRKSSSAPKPSRGRDKPQ